MCHQGTPGAPGAPGTTGPAGKQGELGPPVSQTRHQRLVWGVYRPVQVLEAPQPDQSVHVCVIRGVCSHSFCLQGLPGGKGEKGERVSPLF